MSECELLPRVVKYFSMRGGERENMEHIHVNVKVLNLELSESEEVRLLVDTGSTYTWIPEETLERVGIRRERAREFVTIEGKLVRRDIGMGIVELLGEGAPTVLVFAAEGMRMCLEFTPLKA